MRHHSLTVSHGLFPMGRHELMRFFAQKVVFIHKAVGREEQIMIVYFEAHPAENIGELNGGYRFWYSIFSAVATNELWALADAKTKMPLTHCDDKQQTLVLVWPSLGSAEFFARDEAKNCNPYPISLEKFLTQGIEEFERSNFRISPCPAPNQPFVSCTAHVFAKQVEIARALRHRLGTLAAGCKRATNRECRCKLCGAASMAAMEDSRLAVAMRTTGLNKIWTVQQEWRTARLATNTGQPLLPIWDSEAGANAFIEAHADDAPGLKPYVTSIVDWLYFWTGWLSAANYRLDLNPHHSNGQVTSAGQIAPLVFDRLLRGTFTRLANQELPKCY